MVQISSSRAAYKQDGYYLSQCPIIPAEVVNRAVVGMDAIRAGEYDTGVPRYHHHGIRVTI